MDMPEYKFEPEDRKQIVSVPVSKYAHKALELDFYKLSKTTTPLVSDKCHSILQGLVMFLKNFSHMVFCTY